MLRLTVETGQPVTTDDGRVLGRVVDLSVRLGDAEPVEGDLVVARVDGRAVAGEGGRLVVVGRGLHGAHDRQLEGGREVDRKSTRLNSSH